MVKDFRTINIEVNLYEHFKQYQKVLDKNYIVIHDTGTPNFQNISIVNDYHKSIGFQCIGYDIFIDSQYTYETRRLYENIIGAHTRGWNKKSIGICLSRHGNNNAYQVNILRKIIDVLISIKNFTILFHKDLSKIRNDPDDSIVDLLMTEYPNNAKRFRNEA